MSYTYIVFYIYIFHMYFKNSKIHLWGAIAKKYNLLKVKLLKFAQTNIRMVEGGGGGTQLIAG